MCGALLGCSDDSTTSADAGEGGSPPSTTDGTTACTPVVAADYDQSCTVDSDCVAVGEIAQCSGACPGCTTEAVRKSVAAKYQAALSAAVASLPGPSGCNCACESGAICRAGKCQAAFCGPDRADTLPACANVGGMCAYSANTTCAGVGPAGSCAFSDEFCCLSSPYDAEGYPDSGAHADAEAGDGGASPRDAGLE